jgi:hypothetical protein
MKRVEKVWAVPLSAAQRRLISGQESKKRPEVYQHISPDAVGNAYPGAVQGIGL